MSEDIGFGDLQAGDVLLYQGRGFISDAIRFFDGSDFSHAALYRGGGQVGEAVANGVVKRDIQTSYSGSDRVEAYRLARAPTGMAPVLERANRYLAQGNRYAFEQLVLLAVLCATRALPITPILRRLLRTLLDATTSALTEMISRKRQPMICSEFVYRAYSEAVSGTADEYEIAIEGMLPLPPEGEAVPTRALGVSGGHVHPSSLAALLAPASRAWLEPPAAMRELPAAARSNEAELDGLLQTYMQEARAHAIATGPQKMPIEELAAAADRFVTSLHMARAASATRDPIAARAAAYDYLFQPAPDFVTPADLSKSKSLKRVGVLTL